MKTTHSSTIRFALVAFGLSVAAPVFASTAVPLCGEHGDKGKTTEKEKNKTENSEASKDKDAKKKPVNQG
jgi:hypothetical protein